MPRKRDPQNPSVLMIEGVTATKSSRTGVVTYRGRVTTTGPDGKRQFIADTFKTYREAEAFVLKTRLAISRGSHRFSENPTVTDYHTQWFRRMATSWSGSRQKTVSMAWDRYFRSAFGRMRVQQVSRPFCQGLVDHLAAQERKNGETLSPASVRLYMVGVESMFAAAVKDGLISVNPARDLTYPRQSQAPRSVWSPLQLRTFLVKTRDDEYGPLWAFLVATGCRIGEALALQWSDVDLEAGTVWIHRTLSRGADGLYRPRSGTKTTDAGRTVPLDSWIVGTLRDLPRTGTLVFAKRDGTPQRPNTVRYQWQQAISVARMPAITLHDVRHSVATAMIASGVSERIVQEILGHRSITTTMDTYAHVDVRTQRQGTEAVSRLLGLGSDTTTLRANALNE